MRDDLYAHLQRLDAGFHDSWQSGQLLSRATTDLSAIRRFAGFGTIFLITNIGDLLHRGRPADPPELVARPDRRAGRWPRSRWPDRFDIRYRVLSRRAQDQQGDLATYVEEAAVGIRVLKALGRRGEAAARHVAQARLALPHPGRQGSALRGTFWALLDLVPNLMIGLVLLLGALAVSRHELTLGGLVAYITLALLLVWPIESMGYMLASGQEAATAAQRVYEIFDTEPAITDPAAPPPGVTRPAGKRACGRRCRRRCFPDERRRRDEAQRPKSRVRPKAARGQRRPGASREHQHASPGSSPSTRSSSATRGPAPVLRDVNLELAPGRDRRPGRGHRVGQDHAAEPGAPAGRRDRRGGPPGRHRRQRPAAADCCGPGSAARSRTRRCSPPASGRTSRSARRTPPRRTSGRRWPRPRRRSCTTCPGGLTPGSASRAWRCPAASGSGWRWPGPSWPGRSVLVLDDPLSALDVHTEARSTAALAGC